MGAALDQLTIHEGHCDCFVRNEGASSPGVARDGSFHNSGGRLYPAPATKGDFRAAC